MVEDGVEFSGRTVADAIGQAETYFGVSRAALTVEVISPGRGGVFGIGAEPARIRVQAPASPAVPATTIHHSAEVENVAPAAKVENVAPAAEFEDQPIRAQAELDEEPEDFEGDEESEKAPRRSDADLAQDAIQVLERLLETMGFDAAVSIRSTGNPIMLAVTGQNLGVLIGRRGDNLASLQFMVNLILSKGRRQWPRVVIDVENYRARREESLKSLADRIAYRVSRNGRPFTLEAMPASDRRVIHLSLKERAGIETYSIGEGVARRVVIAPVRQGDYDDGSRQ